MASFKVLIPLDDSEFSRRVVREVCRLFAAQDHEIILLRVAEEPAGVTASPTPRMLSNGMIFPVHGSEVEANRASHPIYASQEWETAKAAMFDELQPDIAYLRKAGYRVSSSVRFGDPAEEINAVVQDEAIDIVAMATHGRTGLRRLVLGSVAEEVVRTVAVPVLLVRPIEL